MILPVLSWKCSSYVGGTGEPEDFIYSYIGDIQTINDSDRRIQLGKFEAYYIDVERAINEGMSVFDVLDTYGHTHEYHEDIFGNSCPEFSEKVQELLGFDTYGSNLLILDRLELLPKYRGTGLGLKVMSHMIGRFSQGAGVVAIKPFPLQFENTRSSDDNWRSKLKLEKYIDEAPLSTNKLVDYYGRLGFLNLPSSPFMVLSTSIILPNIDESA